MKFIEIQLPKFEFLHEEGKGMISKRVLYCVLTVFLVAVVLTGTASAEDTRTVGNGSTVFVYENISLSDAPEGATLTHYSLDGQTADNTISAENGVFVLKETTVKEMYGRYYYSGSPSSENGKYLEICHPDITLEAELTTGADGATSNDSIDGKSVYKDTVVSFLINAPKVGPAYYNATAGTGATAKIVFTTPVGGKITAFGTANFSSITLKASQTLAGYTTAEGDAAAGTYTAQAEYTYPQCFAGNAVKSNAISFTVQSSTLIITAAKDSVVRSHPFTVTISGKAQTVYAVFIEDYKTTTDIIPTLQPGQNGYQSGSDMKTTDGQIAGADFETDANGKRTIQFNTTENTEGKTYTIKVQCYNKDGNLDAGDYDNVQVKVEKGGVTISASGDGSYYIGEKIKLTGTNTDSSNVFLFVTGPDLAENGVVLQELPKKVAAHLAENPVSVETDNTWEYGWNTANSGLDTGAYTIYATSRLTNGMSSNEIASNSSHAFNGVAAKLSDSEYATVFVNLKQTSISAVPSGTLVAKGDKIYIRGLAEGGPNNLMLYIFGPDFFSSENITVEDDGSYEKKIEIPSTMSSGQYFVVIEHPMMNGIFDVKLSAKDGNGAQYFYIENVGTSGTGDQSSFYVTGGDRLQGSQAADALTKMIDSSNSDDIYTKLTFTVANPWITIVNPGDKVVGSKFTITGTTNLAIDDQILVEVMSSSFTAVDKTSTTSVVSQTTKVVAGEGADNIWSAEVDTTNWKPDEYTIKASGTEVDVLTTTNFNLVEKVPVAPVIPPSSSSGAVTVDASPKAVHVGETITFSGSNTENGSVYLFITGPYLDPYGYQLSNISERTPAGKAGSATASVNSGSWEYTWDTSNCCLDTGTYTIYATNRLTNGKGTIADGTAVSILAAEYATTTIELKQPSFTMTPSAYYVQKGETLSINGTATGDPHGLAYYLFGPNTYLHATASVQDDGSYEITIPTTAAQAQDQYYLIIEHPMYNDELDIIETKTGSTTTLSVKYPASGFTTLDPIIVEGTGKLLSVNAANALTTMIDSANIDDIYGKYTFIVYEGTKPQPVRPADTDENSPPLPHTILKESYTPSGNLKPGESATAATDIQLQKDTTIYRIDLGSGLENQKWSGSLQDPWGGELIFPADIPSHVDGWLLSDLPGSNVLHLTVTGTVPDTIGKEISQLRLTERGSSETILCHYSSKKQLIIREGTEVSATVPLSKDWNFISIPKTLASGTDSAENLFAYVNTGNHQILGYDAQTSAWKPVQAGEIIKPLTGYWVYAEEPASLMLSFTNDPSVPAVKTVYPGWNAVGLSADTEANAINAFAGTTWIRAIPWNLSKGSYGTAVTNGGTGDNDPAVNPLQPGWGYWLYVEKPGTLTGLTA